MDPDRTMTGGEAEGDAPLDLATDVLLADGTTAHVRAIGAGDGDALRDFHARLSPESVILRFFGPHPRLSDAEVERFTHVDGWDRLALVAERGGRLVAVSRYDRSPGSDEAEVAFVVDDALQGRGVGTILLEHLASAARRRGVRRFVADTLSENFRMLGVFRDAGFARQFSRDSEVMRVVLDIAPSPEARAAVEERDRRAVVRSMERLLRPTSIAVVGPSSHEDAVGHRIVANLVDGGFRGPVYPVDPTAVAVAGVRAWPSVDDLPGSVDLAVVAVPAETVASVVRSCAGRGAGALVVVSAGFAELGPEGAQRQRALVRDTHASGMRMVGPNSFGVLNTDPSVSMHATLAPAPPATGPIGFASQSGGLGVAILAEANTPGLGLSSFVSFGNKADVSGNDTLLWWEQDPATRVVLLYLESFGNPRRFSRIARRVSRTKPIVAVKSGRSDAGIRGATSHSAALSGSDAAVDALFRRTGVIRVDSIEELFDTAAVLALQPLPVGPRVAVVGNVGGPGVMAADACAALGLDVLELSPATQAALRSFLPVGAGVANPVDLISSASAADYRRALELLADSGEIDAVLVILTPPMALHDDDLAAALGGRAADAGGRPGREDGGRPGGAVTVVASLLGTTEARRVLPGPHRSVPCFRYPETAARALARAVQYARWRSSATDAEPALEHIDANAARHAIEAAVERVVTVEGAGVPDGGTWIAGAAAGDVLRAYGIVGPPRGAAATVPADTVPADTVPADTVPAGTVPADTVPADTVPADTVPAGTPAADTPGQGAPGPGVRIVAGIVQDPRFGPLVTVGIGGTGTGLLGHGATGLAPLTEPEARQLVQSMGGAGVLDGAGGGDPVEVEGLVDLVLRLGRLAEDLPEVAQADCDPVEATGRGVVVLGARLRVVPVPAAVDDRRRLR